MAAKKERYEEELEFICGLYKQDIRKDQLKMQLNVMASNLSNEQNAHGLKSLLHYLKQLSHLTRVLLCDVCALAQLLLVMPGTNVVSIKRSFRSLLSKIVSVINNEQQKRGCYSTSVAWAKQME